MKHMVNEVLFEKITYKDIQDSDSGVLKVIKKEIDFYFYINLKKESDKAVIFSNAAIDPNKRTPPVFMRRTWADSVDGHCIVVDDRTIHNNGLRIGWGIGTPKCHYLKEMSDIIIRIMSLLKVPDNNVVYSGSSMGGFMSLMFATYHTGSKAVVNNPQIFASTYKQGKFLKKIQEKLFSDFSYDEFCGHFMKRISFFSTIQSLSYVPKSLVIFNSESKTDAEHQYKPFIQLTKIHNVNIKNMEFLIYNDVEAGHNAIPKEKNVKLINAYLNNYII